MFAFVFENTVTRITTEPTTEAIALHLWESCEVGWGFHPGKFLRFLPMDATGAIAAAVVKSNAQKYIFNQYQQIADNYHPLQTAAWWIKHQEATFALNNAKERYNQRLFIRGAGTGGAIALPTSVELDYLVHLDSKDCPNLAQEAIYAGMPLQDLLLLVDRKSREFRATDARLSGLRRKIEQEATIKSLDSLLEYNWLELF